MEKFTAEVKAFFERIKEKLSALRQRSGKQDAQSEREPRSPMQKALTAIGITLCAVFSFFLICNLVIIIKGTFAPEKPPSVFGITPMVVLSGSMSGDAEDHIEVGDLVFINKADPDKLKVGDVIAFMDGSTTVTHRIIRIETAVDGSPRWITKGDANNKADSRPVSIENLVGIYSFRIPGLGDVAMFLQRPIGMLVVIGIPCLAFIIYDILRRQRSAAKQSEKTSEMEAELERLRKLVGETAENDAEETEEDSVEESAHDHEPESETETEVETETETESEPSEETEESTDGSEASAEEVVPDTEAAPSDKQDS